MADALATPEVDIDLIDVVDDFNARKKFPKEELEQLAGTIEETGLVQPIKVKEKPDGRFDLVAGERRFRAAKIAGRKTIEITLDRQPGHGNPRREHPSLQSQSDRDGARPESLRRGAQPQHLQEDRRQSSQTRGLGRRPHAPAQAPQERPALHRRERRARRRRAAPVADRRGLREGRRRRLRGGEAAGYSGRQFVQRFGDLERPHQGWPTFSSLASQVAWMRQGRHEGSKRKALVCWTYSQA
ncbi:MAG: ParB N-terminal domain-containing protein [Solirubrobacterales bacterium]